MIKLSYLLFIQLLLPICILGQNTDRIIIGRVSENRGPFTIKGTVMDTRSKEGLVGVNIQALKSGAVASTDADGHFELQLPEGQDTIKSTFIGYDSVKIVIYVLGDGELTIFQKEAVLTLDELVVSGEKADANVKGTELGKTTLSIETLEALPPFAGEVDVFKSIALLPGVSSVGEASSGLNVRGGSSDQNLILLGGAPIYNPSHLFGFFSAFNSDLINNLTLYKGGIPAKYGGRASSVLDLSYKTGDLQSWSGKVTAGIASSKATFEGPVIKNKLSIAASGRVSYVNYLLDFSDDPSLANSEASFYDINGIISYTLNERNQFSYSFYRSFDNFAFASDTSNSWVNQSQVITWNHEFSPSLVMSTKLMESKYSFDIINDSGFDNFEINSDVLDRGITIDFDYSWAENFKLFFGTQGRYYQLNPGTLKATGPESNIIGRQVEEEQALEIGTYIQSDLDISENLGLSMGIRYNYYNFLGPNMVANYSELSPRNPESITGFTRFSSGQSVITYDGWAPRAAVRYSLNKSTSIKAGFNRVFQFIQLISNTATIAPTNTWKLSDSFVEPVDVLQYSVGIFKNFNENTIETSIEGYYKDFRNLVDFEDGANLILQDNIETELVNGVGRAYGIEVYANKKTGRLTGWASYTYSRSLRTIDSPFSEESINNGQEFAANFDKPHDFTIVTKYKISRRTSFSSVFTYSTGRPLTLPAAKFEYLGEEIAFFDSRNDGRIPDYHRLDLSLNFQLFSRKKIFSGNWSLSVYNVYGRKNAFSVFFDDRPGLPPQAFSLTILNSPFPSISYTVEF